MKKFLVAVTAVAALSLLLAPSTGIAEVTSPNEIGLYVVPDAYYPDPSVHSGTDIVGAPVDVYVILSRVEAPDGTPYPTINAFEFRLDFNPMGGLFKLGEAFPPDHINVGDSSNIGEGYLEYVVGLGLDWPVLDPSQVQLVVITFMNFGGGVIEVTVGPITVPSVPGHMVYQAVEGTLVPMYSMAYGSPDSTVFIFQGLAIAVEKESFGSVKALFR